MKKISMLYSVAIVSMSIIGKIQIVCTSALLDSHYEIRKAEYMKTLQILKSYGYNDIYIFEAIKSHGPTFLEDYSSHVIYTNVNDARLRNKGVNESRSLQTGFKQCPFDDNDIVLKLTGRYFFTSDNFLKTIGNNPQVDAFVKIDGTGFLTGCIALRYSLYKKFLEQLNYRRMETEMRGIEYEARIYLEKLARKGKINLMILDKFDLTANVCNQDIQYH